MEKDFKFGSRIGSEQVDGLVHNMHLSSGNFFPAFPQKRKGKSREMFPKNCNPLDSSGKPKFNPWTQAKTQNSLFFTVVPKVRSSNSIMPALFYPPPVRDKLVSLLDGSHQPV